MLTQSLKEGVLSALLLLLAVSGQSAQSTRNPTRLQKNSTEDPLLLSPQKPCGSQDQKFCLNGGTCIYPQDTSKPFCICTSGFSGNRCHYDREVDTMFSRCHRAVEHLISLSCGAAIVVFILVFIAYCVIRRRYTKSTKQMESAPCEVTV
ncbi:epigen [Syngnathus scovelli]|uniref:epigen n=1 Tax=Syngnathus scovelli TaxID=161590 RepID=UPI00210FAF76|nr:epigen [Syngnathus scovelli]